MANWLISVNYSKFNLEKAFDELRQIYWKNDVKHCAKGLQLNDIAYVYVTLPRAKIIYQLHVVGFAEKSEYPVAQKAYWRDAKDLDDYTGAYAILNPVKKVDKANLSRNFLVEQGLINSSDTLQGRRTDRDKQEDDSIKLLLDYVAKQFDSKPQINDYPDEANLSDPSIFEGAKKIVQVNKYERSPEARAMCIKIHGLNCSVCAMNFEKTYGDFAKDFIHVHHIVPMHQINERYEVDPEKDLIPVCPNCHAMLHKQINGVDMTVDKLKQFYQCSAQENKA